MKKIVTPLLLICLILAFISACVKAPDSVKMSAEAPTAEVKSPDSTSDADANTLSVAQENSDTIRNSANETVKKTIELANGNSITINAVADVEGVTSVGAYNYVISSITDDFRGKLFSVFFGDKASEVIYDERNDKWKLSLSDAIGDYYLCECFYPNAGETVPGENAFSLTYRAVDLYPFADNLLASTADCAVSASLDEVISKCNKIMDGIVDRSGYKVDTIQAYGNNGRRPYYKLVYKQIIGNTVFTSFNDIFFLVDNDGIEKISGAVPSLEEAPMTEKIISLDEAAASLESNKIQLDLDNSVAVSKITFEYVAVNTDEENTAVVPVWRFLIGASDDEITINRNIIIAVNALTGDVIYSERGVGF